MAEISRDGGYYIRKAITDKLLSDFNYHAVDGLDSNPIITRTVTPNTPEPYIYIEEVDSNEIWVTKDSESREYLIQIQVVVRDDVGRGTSQQRDQITNQILEIITDETSFPDPSGEGYKIQVVTSGTVAKYEDITYGGKYYIAAIPMDIIAHYVGFNEAQPVAVHSFSYDGFEETPAGKQIEQYDSGTITVNESHADSNGWSFQSVSVAKSQGRNDGTLDGNVLTVDRTDSEIGITSTFTFEMGDQTTTVSTTDNFTRIKSLRYGKIASDSLPVITDSQDDVTGLQNLSNWNIDFRNTNPNGTEISVTVDEGEWIYIIISDGRQLSAITESVLNQNVLTAVFNAPIQTGGYNIYISKEPSYLDGQTYTYTLST